MSIERRHQKRIEYRFDVNIAYRRRSFHGVVKNLTRDGVFIETRLLTIPSGNMIELEFSLGDDKWQISGLIVHTTQSGMGVVFRVPQPELETTVRRLVSEPVPTALNNLRMGGSSRPF